VLAEEEAKALPIRCPKIAEALEMSNTTHTVNLNENNIGADGAKALAAALEKNNTVRTVDLRCNNIGDDGAKALAAALEKNNTVHTVYLLSNNIGADGAKALAAALEKNNTVHTVNLLCNNIGDDGAKALAAALEKKNTLHTVALDSDSFHIGAKKMCLYPSAGEYFKCEIVSNNDDGTFNVEWDDGDTQDQENHPKEHFKAREANDYTLYLDNNNIGADGKKALDAAMEKNSALRILY